MNKGEAKGLLVKELEGWRQRPYADLASLVGGEPVTGQLTGESGVRHGFEIEVFRDRKPAGDIRVCGMVDDGGMRALFPWSDDFMMAPDGSFVGEDRV